MRVCKLPVPNETQIHHLSLLHPTSIFKTSVTLPQYPPDYVSTCYILSLSRRKLSHTSSAAAGEALILAPSCHTDFHLNVSSGNCLLRVLEDSIHLCNIVVVSYTDLEVWPSGFSFLTSVSLQIPFSQHFLNTFVMHGPNFSWLHCSVWDSHKSYLYLKSTPQLHTSTPHLSSITPFSHLDATSTTNCSAHFASLTLITLISPAEHSKT